MRFKHTLFARVALLVVSLAVAGHATAQSLVQLRLEGRTGIGVVERIEGAGTPTWGGHLIEVEIGAVHLSQFQNGRSRADAEREVVLHLHVARGTTGAELATMIGSRLKRASITYELTRGDDDSGSLWIDGATYVNVRAGAGLTASVACTEGAPDMVRILPPTAVKRQAIVHVAGTSAIPVKDAAPIRGRDLIRAELMPDTSDAAAATALWEAATKAQWASSRPGANSWSPTEMASNATLTGLSMTIDSDGDWRLEVTL